MSKLPTRSGVPQQAAGSPPADSTPPVRAAERGTGLHRICYYTKSNQSACRKYAVRFQVPSPATGLPRVLNIPAGPGSPLSHGGTMRHSRTPAPRPRREGARGDVCLSSSRRARGSSEKYGRLRKRLKLYFHVCTSCFVLFF